MLIASVAAYLLAAKAHGLQLRVERELAGYFEVTFRAKNPDFVEALWSRERIIYWSIAAALIAGGIAYGFLASRKAWPLPLQRSRVGLFLLSVAWPLTAAFLIAGLVSVLRTGAWSAGPLWWGAAFAFYGVVVSISWRRR